MTASKGRSGRSSSGQARSNPRVRANASERPERPSRCTSAPAARANMATSSPIVPGPRTSARSPGPRSAAWAERRALPPGSTSAPRAASTESGSACSEPAGTASCSARAPGWPPRTPTSCRCSQTCWWPLRQRRHTPSPSIVSPITRRPTQAGSTPSPTADTTPAHSWPRRIGNQAWPLVEVAKDPARLVRAGAGAGGSGGAAAPQLDRPRPASEVAAGENCRLRWLALGR
jgi:hypothetical protein